MHRRGVGPVHLAPSQPLKARGRRRPKLLLPPPPLPPWPPSADPDATNLYGALRSAGLEHGAWSTGVGSMKQGSTGVGSMEQGSTEHRRWEHGAPILPHRGAVDGARAGATHRPPHHGVGAACRSSPATEQGPPGRSPAVTSWWLAWSGRRGGGSARNGGAAACGRARLLHCPSRAACAPV
jgi:hypothetical protein